MPNLLVLLPGSVQPPPPLPTFGRLPWVLVPFGLPFCLLGVACGCTQLLRLGTLAFGLAGVATDVAGGRGALSPRESDGSCRHISPPDPSDLPALAAFIHSYIVGGNPNLKSTIGSAAKLRPFFCCARGGLIHTTHRVPHHEHLCAKSLRALSPHSPGSGRLPVLWGVLFAPASSEHGSCIGTGKLKLPIEVLGRD
jgi:hypothetical protein